MTKTSRDPDPPLLRARFAVDDVVVSLLHSRAFSYEMTEVEPWAARLERHSLTWIGAFQGGELIGFVNGCWDGGLHVFVLDTIVHPLHQRRGLGQALVAAMAAEAAAAGCKWLHVDYEPHVTGFYSRCGFRSTAAGLIDLAPR